MIFDELKLKLYIQSLTNTPLSWYRIFPTESLSTWNKIKGLLISHFYPKVKSDGARRTITNFKNNPGEGLVRAYKRLRGMINKCPHHDIPLWYVFHIFFGELNQDNKNEIDLASVELLWNSL
jgi:hypothetical protein